MALLFDAAGATVQVQKEKKKEKKW